MGRLSGLLRRIGEIMFMTTQTLAIKQEIVLVDVRNPTARMIIPELKRA